MNSSDSINLVSSYSAHDGMSGPGKVLANLTKGLSRINQRYVLNRALDSTRYVWVHSDFCPLIDLPANDVLSVLGPNLAVLPGDLPGRRPFTNSVYVQPSDWTAQLWLQEGFDRCVLKVWPVGIDTEIFKSRRPVSDDAPVLLYHKRRSSAELIHVQSALEHYRIPFRTLTYGHYAQQEYIDALKEHAFVVWLGCHESQGIALQEALAMNVPILVIDAVNLFYEDLRWEGRLPQRLRPFRTTTAPYFDTRCGIKVDDLSLLGSALADMKEIRATFRPREYILENLTLEKQAKQFVDFYVQLERTHRVAGRRLDGHVDEVYEPGAITRIRAHISHRSNSYRMKMKRVFSRGKR